METETKNNNYLTPCTDQHFADQDCDNLIEILRVD